MLDERKQLLRSIFTPVNSPSSSKELQNLNLHCHKGNLSPVLWELQLILLFNLNWEIKKSVMSSDVGHQSNTRSIFVEWDAGSVT